MHSLFNLPVRKEDQHYLSSFLYSFRSIKILQQDEHWQTLRELEEILEERYGAELVSQIWDSTEIKEISDYAKKTMD